MTSTFDQFKLSPGTLDAVAAMGYEEPSPIQEQAIPLLLAGRDLVGQARTGTGKTAAFGIPLIEAARQHANAGAFALVLVPTRELALQVSEEIAAIAKGSRVRVVAVYGGVGMGKQVDALRSAGTQVLVATPGRLIDHMQQGTARLDRVRHLVLDEADRMLDMGFLPDIERILRQVPRERQTALLSATMPEPIRRLAQRFLRDPASVRVESGPEATPAAEQFHIRVEKADKSRALLALLGKEKPERAVVFTRTKHLAKRLAGSLQRAGHEAVALQGNMSQGQRERAMAAFRTGEARLLIATDIASRGIDVPEVSHVINFDLPDEPEAYVHRIGRTGRMGRSGRAFTFVQSDEVHDMRGIQRATPVQIVPYELGELPPEPPRAPEAPRGPANGHGRNGHGGRGGGQGPRNGHAYASGDGASRGPRHGGRGSRPHGGGGRAQGSRGGGERSRSPAGESRGGYR